MCPLRTEPKRVNATVIMQGLSADLPAIDWRWTQRHEMMLHQQILVWSSIILVVIIVTVSFRIELLATMGHPEKEGSHPDAHQKHEETATSASQHISALTSGENEKAVLDRQIAGPSIYLSSARFLLSCTSVFDGVVLIVSAVAAIIAGAANPFAMVSLGVP